MTGQRVAAQQKLPLDWYHRGLSTSIIYQNITRHWTITPLAGDREMWRGGKESISECKCWHNSADVDTIAARAAAVKMHNCYKSMLHIFLSEINRSNRGIMCRAVYHNACFMISITHKTVHKDSARWASHHNAAAAGCENRRVPPGCPSDTDSPRPCWTSAACWSEV